MTDLVIIGAGVIGLAIAREASQSGLETIVLEKKIGPGMIHPLETQALFMQGFIIQRTS